MRKVLLPIIALIVFGSLTVTAQFTITIPKIPKIKKSQAPSQPPPTAGDNPSSTSQAASEPASRSEEPKKGGCSSSNDAVLGVYLEDIEKTRKEAESYDKTRDYYVSDFNDNENMYLKAALSPSRRSEWFKNLGDLADCVTPALDNLAGVARKTLPLYQAPAYNIHNPAEERLLLAAVKDIGEAKVFKTGMLSASWRIAKDDYNFPTSRYKYGMIWARYPNRDDGFCRLIFVNIVQDYSGGGTYGDSYGNFIKSEYAGCPAGTK